MKIAIYPGSFDPVTSGHLNIIRRAAAIFEKVIVCVMVNSAKHPMFNREERVDLIRRVTAAGSDFENEFQMALINRKLNPDLDTMFLTAEHQFTYLSSSTVKELGSYGVDLSDFLPEQIIPDFQERMRELRQGGNN